MLNVLAHRVQALLPVMLAVSSCGPRSTFNGSVAGNGLTVAESVFVVGHDSITGQASLAYAYLSDQTGICESLRRGALPKQSTTALFMFVTFGPALAPGEFTYKELPRPEPGRHLWGGFLKFDAACAEAPRGGIIGGAANLSAIQTSAGGSLVASFDADFRTVATTGEVVSMDTVSGSLNAKFCDVEAGGSPIVRCDTPPVDGGCVQCGGPVVSSFFPKDYDVGTYKFDSASPSVLVADSYASMEALIDGDAAPFIAKGAAALGWGRYASGPNRVDARVWQMKSVADAADTYGYLVTDVSLYKANTWTALSGVGDEGRIADTGGSWWLNARKGAYVVEVRITPHGAQPRADVEAFAKAVIGKMP